MFYSMHEVHGLENGFRQESPEVHRVVLWLSTVLFFPVLKS